MEEKIYKCEYCNYETKYKTNYNLHTKTKKHLKNLEKPNEEKNKCEICNKKFSSAQALKNHNSSRHLNEKNKKEGYIYYCEYCGTGNNVEKLYKKHTESNKHIRLMNIIKNNFLIHFNTI